MIGLAPSFRYNHCYCHFLACSVVFRPRAPMAGKLRQSTWTKRVFIDGVFLLLKKISKYCQVSLCSFKVLPPIRTIFPSTMVSFLLPSALPHAAAGTSMDCSTPSALAELIFLPVLAILVRTVS